jgi:hypothetical protein
MAKASAEVITHCPNSKCGKPIYSDHLYSWCIECGEPLPDNIQAQIPRLQESREGAASVTSSQPAPPERLSSRELLERLVRLQEQQNESLEAIRKHTGCVYAWLIFSVILGTLVFLIVRH